MVNFGTCLPKARTIGSVMEWSPPRQTGRKPWSSNSPTLFSMAANGSLKVNFKSPASQYAPSALRSTPVSVQLFAEIELKATRMMGGAPAAPRNHEEFASKGTPRMTGVPALAASGWRVMGIFLYPLNQNNRGERIFAATSGTATGSCSDGAELVLSGAEGPRPARAEPPEQSLLHLFVMNRPYEATHPLFYRDILWRLQLEIPAGAQLLQLFQTMNGNA